MGSLARSPAGTQPLWVINEQRNSDGRVNGLALDGETQPNGGPGQALPAPLPALLLALRGLRLMPWEWLYFLLKSRVQGAETVEGIAGIPALAEGPSPSPSKGCL